MGLRPGKPQRHGSFLLYAIALFPAIIFLLWFGSWRYRWDHTRVEQPIGAGLLFDDAEGLLRSLAQARISESTTDSTRLRLACGAATLLLLADQLADLQSASDLCLKRMRVKMGSEPQSAGGRDSEEAESWVYRNLLAGIGREELVPASTPGRSDLARCMGIRAAYRETSRHGGAPSLPTPELPFGPDTSLDAGQAVQVCTIRETALAQGLAGDALSALSLLRATEPAFAGTFVFGEARTRGDAGAPLRLLRYPDMMLPADLSRILTNGLVPLVDSLWVSLIPASGDWTRERGEETDPAPLESFLRWKLACLHASRGDSTWFRRQAGRLAQGPLLFHRWTRLLARDAGVSLPEPQSALQAIQSLDPAARAALPLADSLALGDAPGHTWLPPGGTGRGTQVRRRLEPLVQAVDLSYGMALLPLARSLALAFPEDDYVAGYLRDLTLDPGLSTPLPLERWQYLVRARILAAQAVGLLRKVEGKNTGPLPEVVDQLGFWARLPWNQNFQGTEDKVRLVGYVPGLVPIWHVTILAVQGRYPQVSAGILN